MEPIITEKGNINEKYHTVGKITGIIQMKKKMNTHTHTHTVRRDPKSKWKIVKAESKSTSINTFTKTSA